MKGKDRNQYRCYDNQTEQDEPKNVFSSCAHTTDSKKIPETKREGAIAARPNLSFGRTRPLFPLGKTLYNC
jgi:hypothetical protein